MKIMLVSLPALRREFPLWQLAFVIARRGQAVPMIVILNTSPVSYISKELTDNQTVRPRGHAKC